MTCDASTQVACYRKGQLKLCRPRLSLPSRFLPLPPQQATVIPPSLAIITYLKATGRLERIQAQCEIQLLYDTPVLHAAQRLSTIDFKWGLYNFREDFRSAERVFYHRDFPLDD